VALLFAACSLASKEGFRTEVRDLPTCGGLAAPTALEWPRQLAGGEFSLALPSCFVREYDGGLPEYIHGGVRWRCGAAKVEVIWGIWGRDSFPALPKCTMDVSTHEVMVGVGSRLVGPLLTVWYPTGDLHEPLVAVWSARPDDEPVKEIALSGRIGLVPNEGAVQQ
jgi:hypothetical protein